MGPTIHHPKKQKQKKQKPEIDELQNNEVKAFMSLMHTQTKSNALKEEALCENQQKKTKKKNTFPTWTPHTFYKFSTKKV